MEANWTPNDEETNGGGPLPLSMQQRQELLKLEEAIRSSPDPQSTLVSVAEANQMSPEELVGMLNRNRQDLEAAGHRGVTVPRTSRSPWRALTSLCVAGGKLAKRHPRTTAVLATGFITGAYVGWDIPRTGLVLSNRKSLFSKGASTVFAPPSSYMESAIEQISTRPSSVPKSFAQKIDESYQQGPIVEDGVPHRLDLGKNVRSTVTVSSVLTAEDLRGIKFENVIDDIVLEAAWEQGVTILNQRSLTDFCSGYMKLYMVEEHGILLIRGLGDWGRFALLPLQIIRPRNLTASESSLSLTFSTVEGSHWDAQMHVQLYLGEDELHIRVTLLFPKRGPSESVASSIVKAMHESIVTSLRTRTRQILARQSQSSRFQKAAQEKANVRRVTRASKERAIEEMAADRRRRWQRTNPNSGSYRPSGDRMRSPNNAVY
jgi:hypothetical protein